MATAPAGDSDGMAATATAIEVRIRELSQLFNSLDPSPFHERDLDDDAEDYIVGWARELPHDVPLRIVIHLPAAEAAKAREIGIPDALAQLLRRTCERRRAGKGNVAPARSLAMLAEATAPDDKTTP